MKTLQKKLFILQKINFTFIKSYLKLNNFIKKKINKFTKKIIIKLSLNFFFINNFLKIILNFFFFLLRLIY